MVKYNWSTIKYYINEKDESRDVKVTYWQYVPLLNYGTNNFYFLINNFFFNHKNINSILVSSFSNNNIKNYQTFGDETKLFHNKFNFSLNESSFLTEFFYLRNSSFIKFFINNMVDVPICFKKSHSLKTKNFELPLLKFSNFLMKKGKKEKTFRFIFNTFRTFFNSLKLEQLKINEQSFSWFNFYHFTSTIQIYYNLNENAKTLFSNDVNIPLFNNNFFFNNHKTINSSFFLKNYLYSLLSKVSPIFSYFIYSVDKNIRKYSRGKSGKYTFIWKYVAPYKRIQLAMRLLIKDIKFHQSQKFDERLLKTFENLMLSPEKSFAWKSKIFSHNYVFKNFRKSLMTSLKTTS